MHTTYTLSLSTGTVELLRKRATDAGVPIGRIADALLSNALTHLSDDELRQHTQQAKVEQQRLHMSRWERVVMDALKALTEKFAEHDNPYERGRALFTLKEFKQASGLYPSEALKGLRDLERRGELMCFELQEQKKIAEVGDLAPEVEHWGLVPERIRKMRAR
jgi:hypothetical protein